MMFSARSRAEIDLVRQRLLAAGIQCEVRNFPVERADAGPSSYPELWVESNADYHTASILYASPVSVLRRRTSS